MSIFGPPDISELENARDVSGLIKALRHQEPYTREKAAIALGRIRDARAVDPLCTALEDGDSDVRRGAANALIWFGESAGETLGEIAARAVEPLAKALGDPEPVVRWMAAKALGAFGDRRCLDSLLERLQALPKDAWSSREDIARALENVPDSRALEPLLAELETKNRNAPIALARIGGDRVRRALMEILENREIFEGGEIKFREAAVTGLAMLGDNSVIAPILDALSHECMKKWGG